MTKASMYDHCTVIKRYEDGLKIILVLFVDDILIGATSQKVIDDLYKYLIEIYKKVTRTVCQDVMNHPY